MFHGVKYVLFRPDASQIDRYEFRIIDPSTERDVYYLPIRTRV